MFSVFGTDETTQSDDARRFFKMCFYRTVSLKIGFISRKLPLFLSFVVRSIIGWLPLLLISGLPMVKKMVSIAHSG